MKQIKIFRLFIRQYLKNAVVTLFLLFSIVQTVSALPVLSDITIIAGKRGVAVSFAADAPFTITFSGHEKTITAHLKGCVYGLPDFLYTDFPEKSPLKSITATEKKESAVDITFVLKHTAVLPIKTIQKQNKWIALLSNQVTTPFSWKSNQSLSSANQSTPIAPAVTPSVKKPKTEVSLQNIRLLQRGLISELAFDFNGEVSSSIKRTGKKVILTIENTKIGISNKQFSLPDNAVFKRLSFTENVLDSVPVITISVIIDTAHTESNFNIASTQGEVISLFCMQRTNHKATLWTSGHGLAVDYQFYDVPSYKVDMKSIGKRAIHDAAQKLRKNNTFAIKNPATVDTKTPDVPATPSPIVDVPTPQKGSADRPPMQQNSIIMEVVSNNVNVRSSPSIKGEVIDKASRGDRISVIKILKHWNKVSINGKTGYIYSTLLRESSTRLDEQQVAETTDTSPSTAVPTTTQTPQLTKVSTTPVSESTSFDSETVPQNTKEAIKEMVKKESSIKRVIRYNGSGRDPFKPIVPSSISLSGLPFVDHLALVGVLYDDVDRIALCEDRHNNNRPFAFREHDPIEKGKVLKIYPDKVVFLITEYGISRSFTLNLSNDKRRK